MFAIITMIADGVFVGIVGIRGVAFRAGFVAIAVREVEDKLAGGVGFGLAFVGGRGLRFGTIGHDGSG